MNISNIAKQFSDIINSDKEEDLYFIKFDIVEELNYKKSSGKKELLKDHIVNVGSEFTGKSSILLWNSSLIISIRRKINKEKNKERFIKLWINHHNYLVEMLDTRWLISVSDTFFDISYGNEKDVFMSASLLGNICKLYETERVFLREDTEVNHEKVEKTKEGILFDGLTSFTVGRGDLVSNIISRLQETEPANHYGRCILLEIFNRMQRHDTILRRLRLRQEKKLWPAYISSRADGPLSGETASQPSFMAHPSITVRDDQPGYILLNDTWRSSGGYHCGPGFVCQTIRAELSARGLKELGWANSLQGFNTLIDILDKKPALVVLNGEGSMHHGAERARELLECCAVAHRQAVPTVLINSVWQDNPKEFEKYLKLIDAIYVRDSFSASEMPDAVNARVVPDISVLAFSNYYASGNFTAPYWELGVIDSVVRQRAEALQDLAVHRTAPFFCMLIKPVSRLRERAAQSNFPAVAYPQILDPLKVVSASSWVTGRFHGLIAILAAGLPVCALPSNTRKIEGLLSDAELKDEVLLPPECLKYDREVIDREINERLQAWNSGTKRKASNFIEESKRIQSDMFDNIAKIAASGTRLTNKISEDKPSKSRITKFTNLFFRTDN